MSRFKVGDVVLNDTDLREYKYLVIEIDYINDLYKVVGLNNDWNGRKSGYAKLYKYKVIDHLPLGPLLYAQV